MLQKRCALLLTVLLILLACVPLPVTAASPCTVASCYWQDGTMYTAIAAEELSEPLQATILLNHAAVGQPQTAREAADVPVKYLLLVDQSSSMRHRRDSVAAFAQALFPEDQPAPTVTVAGFGAKFSVIAEDLDSAAEVSGVLQKMQYDQTSSDISDGLICATECPQAQPAIPGELVNLVLLTDGAPYVGTNGSDTQTIARAAKAASERIKGAPELIVHTVYIGSSDPDKATKAAATAGTGQFFQIRAGKQDAAEAAASVTAYVRGLNCYSFPVKWESTSSETEVEFRLSTKEFLTVSHVRNLDRTVPSAEPETETNEDLVIVHPETTAMTETTSVTVTSAAEPATTAETTDVPETVEAPEPSENAPAGEPETGTEPVVQGTEPEPPEQGSSPLLFALIGGGCTLLAVIVILAVLRGIRSTGKAAPSGNGICITMELLGGTCATPQREFRMQNELLIGSDKRCDIVLPEAGIAPQNTRIFVQDQMLYIEDLNPESSTLLSGMKIHAPNRLRSGDEITVGNVHMRFRF